MKSNCWRFFLAKWENYPSFFLFYFIIACYLHVCTHVNVCMCGGQRLTLDILFFPFLTFLLDKPPTAPGVNPFGYSDWEKSHRDFPAASSHCCSCRHSYCARVRFRTGNLSSSPQACIANRLPIKALLCSFQINHYVLFSGSELWRTSEGCSWGVK